MKKVLLSALAAFFALTSSAQLVGIEVETVISDIGMTADGVDLTGYSTYRLYAVCQNSDDFVSSIYGNEDYPMNIETTTSFWQSDFGSNSGDLINPALYGTFESLIYDSWYTIGRQDSDDPGGPVQAIESECDPFLTEFAMGNNMIIDCIFGGTWFITFPDVNGFVDIDNRVLIGQFTTDGSIFGNVNVQVFPNGDGNQWNEGDGSTNNSFSSGDDIFGCTDPLADNYNPDATIDDNSCIYPCALAITDVTTTLNACNGDQMATITVTAEGGQGSVEFDLDGGNPQISPTFNNLFGGIYTLTATDGQGCIATQEVDISDPDAVAIDIFIVNDVLCSGESSGVISGDAAGGTGSLLFGLEEGTYTESTPDFSDLGPGTYTVYGIDENNCTGVSASLTLTDPEPIVINSAFGFSATCADTEDGNILVNAEGGTGELSYSSNGVDFQSEPDLPVSPGDYTVSVMDENGCVTETENTVPVNGPDPITILPVTVDPTCNGDTDGSIDVSATDGGNGGFMWSFDGGAFTMTTLYEVLGAGEYTIDVEDVEGCTAFIEVELVAPDAVTATADATDVSCNGDGDGSIEVTAAGGNGEYTYQLDGNDPQDDPNFPDLGPNDYDITVTDSNGCVSDVVTATVDEPDAIEVTATDITEESEPGAEDGEIDITVTGGTGTLSFDWSGPGGFSDDSEDIDGLADGDYTVTITDENGCEEVVDVTVTTGIEELFANITVTVSPNPSNGQYRLTLDGMNGQNILMNILDATGRLIVDEEITGNGMIVNEIDLTSEASGIYFMQLQLNGQASMTKLIKQ